MKVIDCLSEMCPIPILRIMRELPKMVPGESIKVVTDHSCVVESIKDKLKSKKLFLNIDEVINGVWEIIITKH